MDDGAKDLDRDLLRPRQALWANDPEQTLTEDELDRLVRHFGVFEDTVEPDLRSAVNGLFQRFIDMAIDERFREHDGQLRQAQKPSTIVEAEMRQVRKTIEKLDEQLAGLDQATKVWLDQYLKEAGIKDESNKRVRWRHLEEGINRPIDLLIGAAHSAEGLTSRGPNNTALRFLIDHLAWRWEICHGKPPIADKGRGRQSDPFLELCQEMAGIGNAKLKARGGRLFALQLSGLVAEVLRDRRSRPSDIPREK